MKSNLLKDLELLISKQTNSIKHFFMGKIQKIEQMLHQKEQKSVHIENELKLAKSEIKVIKNEVASMKLLIKELEKSNKSLAFRLESEKQITKSHSINKTKELKRKLSQKGAAEKEHSNDNRLET